MTDKTPPVEQFDPNWFDRSMDYSASGGYVRYSDYTTLYARLALSEGALDICSKAWGECNTQLDAAKQRIAELAPVVVTLLPEGRQLMAAIHIPEETK